MLSRFFKKYVLHDPAYRKNFIPLIDTSTPTLEIGPFFSPALRGGDVYYFDVLDRDGLIEHARSMNLGEVQPPFIHYVSPYGDLTTIDRAFSNIFSSHCIEHQPDLVSHLQNVGNLLDKGGRYYVVAPDKRYCFDHFLPKSLLSDVICAHAEKRTNHTMATVIRHCSQTTHNEPKRHWRGDHADPGYSEGIAARALNAVDVYRASEGYFDSHAWQFTPDSFRSICQQLYDLKLSPLRPTQVRATQRGYFEFTAILEKDV